MTSGTELNKGHRDLIFGYIHEFENKWEDLLITEAIIFIVAVYYIDTAEFDVSMKSENMTISGWDNRIVKHDERKGIYWRSIFGKRVFKHYGKYEWNLKVVENQYKDKEQTMAVGIIKNEYCNHKIRQWAFASEQGIAISGGSKKGLTEDWWVEEESDGYGATFGIPGDTLKMILDLDELTLTFVINGVDYGPAITKDNSYHFDLNKHSEYRFGLSLFKGTQVQLVDNTYD